MAAALTRDAWLAEAMAVACGMWGWPPEEFWRATPADMNLILQGLKKARRAADPAAFDESDIDHLRELIRSHQ